MVRRRLRCSRFALFILYTMLGSALVGCSPVGPCEFEQRAISDELNSEFAYRNFSDKAVAQGFIKDQGDLAAAQGRIMDQSAMNQAICKRNVGLSWYMLQFWPVVLGVGIGAVLFVGWVLVSIWNWLGSFK